MKRQMKVKLFTNTMMIVQLEEKVNELLANDKIEIIGMPVLSGGTIMIVYYDKCVASETDAIDF